MESPRLPAVEFTTNNQGFKCVDKRNYLKLYERELLMVDYIKTLEYSLSTCCK